MAQQTTSCQGDSRVPSANERVALHIHEVCRLTGLGRTSIYSAIAAGHLVARKFGRRTIILLADLEMFLNKLPPVARRNKHPSSPTEPVNSAHAEIGPTGAPK